MAFDLFAPLMKAAPSRRLWPTLPGESAMGRLQPSNYRGFIQADNSWVFACARINAQSVAKVPIRLFQRNQEDEDTEIVEHPFIDLLRSVNPYMNEFELKELTDLHLELTGNAYWYLAPTRLAGANGRAIPGEIWPLLSQYVKIVPGQSQMIDGYLYQLPTMARPLAFDDREIVHFKFPHPDSLFYGKGCVEGGRFAIDSNEYQKRYEIATFKNMGRPDGVLSSEQELTDAQVERLRIQWQSLHGGADRSGNIAVLEKGLSYTNTAFNPKELDYMRGREATREEICTMFGVPAAKLGIVTDVNRANGEAVDYTYQAETILPRLRRIQEKINEQVISRYDPTLYVEFDDPVPENNERKLLKINAYLDRGVYTINEVREQDGDEPVPWGDEPFSMMGGPVSTEEMLEEEPTSDSDQPSQDDEDEDEDDDEEDEDEDQKAVTKAKKPEHWYRFIRVVTPHERRFYRDLQDFFIQQRRMVESNLSNYQRAVRSAVWVPKANEPLVANILFPKAKEQERLAKRSQPFIEASVQAGSDFGLAHTGATIDFDVLNPLVLTAVKQRVAFFSKRVTETTAEALTDQIAAGIAQGESITQIASRIDDLYDQLLGYRSLRIARTETISAANSGALLSYKAAGYQRKQWFTANDEFVRESHQEAQGQIVGMNQPFTVGGELLDHPGDPSGSPEQIINCRCIADPVIER